MRTILHSDLNAFYASVEELYTPRLRSVPMAVCGDPQARHGIILTKNQLAKGYGVKTGEAIWQARQKCPHLVLVPSNMDRYVEFARRMRAIYADYTDRVEPFGMDEAWLDVTGEDGAQVADAIRTRARRELGITASVGVADNKIFAKLGSDMQKPDATTIISGANYRKKVWPLPVSDLLYVGPSARKTLSLLGIHTIGALATADRATLHGMLGKAGDTLHTFANGADRTPVARLDDEPPAKSIGNSTTTSRDIENESDARWVFTLLGESIGMRLRKMGLQAEEIQIWVRDTSLASLERQMRLPAPTNLDGEIIECAMTLLKAHYGWMRPLRSLGIRTGGLSLCDRPQQLSLFDDPGRERQRALLGTMDALRGRYGDACIRKGLLFVDTSNAYGKPLAQPPHREYKPFECVRQG